jgi:hypothetical protein
LLGKPVKASPLQQSFKFDLNHAVTIRLTSIDFKSLFSHVRLGTVMLRLVPL